MLRQWRALNLHSLCLIAEPRLLDTTFERAVTATLILPRSAAAVAHDPCAEICALAFAAGAEVVDSLVQRLSVPYVRTGFGRGKVREMKERLEASDSKLLIVDFDLSPSQGRNLEKDLGVRVVDRTGFKGRRGNTTT